MAKAEQSKQHPYTCYLTGTRPVPSPANDTLSGFIRQQDHVLWMRGHTVFVKLHNSSQRALNPQLVS